MGSLILAICKYIIKFREKQTQKVRFPLNLSKSNMQTTPKFICELKNALNNEFKNPYSNCASARSGAVCL